jgi:WD40 repeat protein
MALMSGLGGAADAGRAGGPGDGVITATELYLYLEDRLLPAPGSGRPRQTPILWPLKKHDKGQFVFLVPGRELNLPDAPPLNLEANPWRGLQPYERTHSDLFFGRRRVSEALAERVLRESLVVVTGPSGIGKSSLVRAGLLPRMDVRRFKPVVIRPGAAPFASLAAGLPTSGVPAPSEQTLKTDPNALATWISTQSNQNQILLVIDQAEELSTQNGDPQVARAFLTLVENALAQSAQEPVQADSLTEAEAKTAMESIGYGNVSDLKNDGPIWHAMAIKDGRAVPIALDYGSRPLRVVLTVRSEFEPQFAQSPLKKRWPAARYLVPQMTQDELRRVIEGPAAVKVMRFESADLVDRLVNEVVQMPGALPLLSFALSAMYKKYLERRSNDRTLTQQDYDALEGGITGSLKLSADKLVNSLDSSHQDTARRVLERLVSIEAGEYARRRVLHREFEASDPNENARVANILACLDQERLLVTDEVANQRYAELAHDALILGWDRLLNWIRKDADLIVALRRLTADANEAAADQNTDLLWDDPARTAIVKQLQREPFPGLNAVERRFAAASLRRGRRNQIIWWTTAAALMLLTVGVSAAAIYATSQSREAKRQQVVAQQQQTRAEHSEAESLTRLRNSQTVTSRLLADLAGRLSDAGDHRTALALALEAMPSKRFGRDRPYVEVAEQAAFRAVQENREIARFRHNGAIQSARMDKSARLLAVSMEGRGTCVWDIVARTLLYSVALDGTLSRAASDSCAPPDTSTTTNGESEELNAAAAISRSGKQVVVVRSGTTLEGRDARTANVLWNFEVGSRLTVIAISPSETRVAFLAANNTGGIISLDNGHPVVALKWSRDRLDTAVSLVWSDDERQLAASDSEISFIWNTTRGGEPELKGNGFRSISNSLTRAINWSPAEDDQITTIDFARRPPRELRVAPPPQALPNAAAITPDGRTILVADQAGRLYIKPWDAARWITYDSFLLQRAEDIAVARDGSVFAVSYPSDASTGIAQTGIVGLWSKAENSWIARLGTGPGSIKFMVLSDDGTMLAVGSSDGQVRIFSSSVIPPYQKVFGGFNGISGVQFDSSGNWIAAYQQGGAPRIIDIASGKQIGMQAIGANDREISFAPNGKTLAVIGEGEVRLFDRKFHPIGKPIRHDGKFQSVFDAQFSRDGTALITTGGDGLVKIWNTEDGSLALKLARADQFAARATPSFDTKYIAVDGIGGLQVLSIANAAVPKNLSQGVSSAVSAWHPSRNILASGDKDVSSVQIWDFESGKTQSRAVPSDGTRALAFDPTGKWLAAGGQEGWVWLLELDNDNVVKLDNGPSEMVSAMRWSPDGRFLAMNRLRGQGIVYDTATKTVVTTTAESTEAKPVDFTADGRFMITVKGSQVSQLWRLGDLKVIAQFKADRSETEVVSQDPPAPTAAFSRDGSWLATTHVGKTVRLWRLWHTTDALIEEACHMGVVPLTTEQRRTLLGDEGPETSPCSVPLVPVPP